MKSRVLNPTNLLYILGKPSIGQYTISKELANFGYLICDHQLINNPIFTLLSYEGFAKLPDFAWDIITETQINIWQFLTLELSSNYALTNILYDAKENYKFYEQIQQIALLKQACFIPIRLLISEDEHLKHTTQYSQSKRWNAITSQDIYGEKPLISISSSNLLELDVTNLSPKEAAEIILAHINLVQTLLSDLF